VSVYQPPAITVDRTQIQADIITALEVAIPGMTVAAGSPLWALTLVWSDRHAELLELLAARAEGEYQAFGEKILHVPFQDATFASTTATITTLDSDGHVIDAGTQISLTAPDGTRVAFQVAEAVAIPAGSDSTATGEVTLIAVEAGGQATGLFLDPLLERPLAWIETITIEAPTIGGADAETADEYVDELSDATLDLSDTVVTPDDALRRVLRQPGIGRALAIDLYDATTSTANVGGHITIAAVDDNGQDVSADTKTAAAAIVTRLAMTQLAVHIVNPNRTMLAVSFTGVAEAGAVAVDVQARAIAAVQAAISPATWGRPEFTDRGAPNWINAPVVRFQDISAVLNGVDGFDHWTALTINGGTADVTMTGIAPLPDPASTVTGTVV
jgi:hypothetical protein